MDEGGIEQASQQPSIREAVSSYLLSEELGPMGHIPTNDEEKAKLIGDASSTLQQILGQDGTTAIRALAGVAIQSDSEKISQIINGKRHDAQREDPAAILKEINELSSDLQCTILGGKGVRALRVLLGTTAISERDGNALLSLGSGVGDLSTERLQDENYAVGIVNEAINRIYRSPASRTTEQLKRMVGLSAIASKH